MPGSREPARYLQSGAYIVPGEVISQATAWRAHRHGARRDASAHHVGTWSTKWPSEFILTVPPAAVEELAIQ